MQQIMRIKLQTKSFINKEETKLDYKIFIISRLNQHRYCCRAYTNWFVILKSGDILNRSQIKITPSSQK